MISRQSLSTAIGLTEAFFFLGPLPDGWEMIRSPTGQVLTCFTGTKVLAYWCKSTNTDT